MEKRTFAQAGRVLALLASALVTLGLVLVVGGGFGFGTALAAGQVIKIGAMGPFTGELSKIGLDSLHAIEMAVADVNASGGIAGNRVEVVVADDAADPSKAILVAEKLAMDRAVLGVVGPMNSSTAAASLPSFERAGLVVISQSATNPDLTEKGFKVMHRLCARDDAQGPAAARFIIDELKAHSVYIIDDKSTYGQGLADQVEEALRKAGVKRVERGQLAAADKDFSALLTRIKGSSPDLIYLALPNPAQGASLIKQAAGLGLKVAFMGGDGLKEKDQFIKGATGYAEGAYVTAIGRNIREVPEAAEFVKKFEAKYGAMSIYAGQSYEAARLLLDAIVRAAAGSRPPTRQAVLQAVHNVKGFEGILGFPIRFDRKGDLVGSSIYVYEVRGGDFVQVKEYRSGVNGKSGK